jgi:TorA maturation chaperone TorD
LALRRMLPGRALNPRDLDLFPLLKEACPLDHIGFELAFAAFLIWIEHETKEELDQSAWRKLQLQFLREHLLNWIPHYANKLNVRTRGYYVAY